MTEVTKPHDSARAISRRVFLAQLGLLSTASAFAQPRRLRLGYFPNLTHAQALYAHATGRFERALGSPIEWIPLHAGPSAIEALFVDAIDATYIGPSPTINGHVKSKGSKFVIVAGSASGGAGLVVRRDSGIRSVRDFHGKVIATPQLGNTQDLSARAWFARQGYRLKERGGTVALAALSNPDQLTMFLKKQIDGAWTIEPWVARLMIEGDGQLFLDEKSLWPGGRYTTTHLVVNQQFLADQKALIEKLIAAHIEITQLINADKAASAEILNAQLKKETGKSLKPEVMTMAMEHVEFTWDPIAPSLYESAAAAHQIRFLRNPPQLRGIYSLNLLNEILRGKNLTEVSDSPIRS